MLPSDSDYASGDGDLLVAAEPPEMVSSTNYAHAGNWERVCVVSDNSRRGRSQKQTGAPPRCPDCDLDSGLASALGSGNRCHIKIAKAHSGGVRDARCQHAGRKQPRVKHLQLCLREQHVPHSGRTYALMQTLTLNLCNSDQVFWILGRSTNKKSQNEEHAHSHTLFTLP